MCHSDTNLNPSDLQKMTASEVADLADLDFYAVRDEGFRRQALAEKKLVKLERQLAAVRRQMNDAAVIIQSALSEQQRVNL